MIEDRRTAIAVFLCILVVLVYTQIVFAPYNYQARQAAIAKNQDNTNLVANGAALTAPTTSLATSQNSSTSTSTNVTATQLASDTLLARPTQAELAQSPVTKISSDLVSLTINHLGARISNYGLTHYKETLGSSQPFEMATYSESSALPLGVYFAGLSDERVNYKLVGSSAGLLENAQGVFELPNNQDASFSFHGIHQSGMEITKTFGFSPGSYLLKVDVKLSRPSPDGSRIYLEWTHFDPNIDAKQSWDFHGFRRLNEKLVSVHANEVTKELADVGDNRWLAYADKYFMTALMPATAGTAQMKQGRDGNVFIARISGESQTGSFKLFIGPKQYDLLESLGSDLHRAIDLGFFSFLASPLLSMIKVFYSLLGNYGLAIVLLTLVIKFLFLPLTIKSFRSMQAMQDLQPEMTALRAKFKDEPTKMNQELMALYKKKGVNPLGGCFPVLIQIPVFLGLYNALLNSIELRHANFALWVHDLSAPEALPIFGIGVPVMVVLLAVSMLLQQMTTPSTMDPAQKKMMMIMSVGFTVFFIGFPAGLTLYWLVNSVISIIQQHYIRSHKGASPITATAVASVLIFGFTFLLTRI